MNLCTPMMFHSSTLCTTMMSLRMKKTFCNISILAHTFASEPEFATLQDGLHFPLYAESLYTQSLPHRVRFLHTSFLTRRFNNTNALPSACTATPPPTTFEDKTEVDVSSFHEPSPGDALARSHECCASCLEKKVT